jgi:hypothetical protein
VRPTRSARLDLGQAVSLLRKLDGERVLCRVVGGTGAPIRVEGRLVCSFADHRDAISFTVGPSAAFTVGAGQFADGRREGVGIRIDTGAGRPLRRITVEPAPARSPIRDSVRSKPSSTR